MRFYLICLALFVSATASAQGGKNLVLNPSFEIHADSAAVFSKKSAITSAKFWSSPNESASEVYSSTKRGDKYAVFDPWGASWDFQARTGKNVGGLTVYGDDKRNYIQGMLNAPLTVGKKYYFSFFVHYHCQGANNIGIAFFSSEVKQNGEGVLPVQPVSRQMSVTKYDKTKTWTLVRDSFIAHKPFQYFVIGNFMPDSLTQTEFGSYNHFFAFIDDIAVIEAKNQNVGTLVQEVEAKEKAKWDYNEIKVKQKNTAIELKDVFFEYGTDRLLELSYAALDNFAAQLAAAPDIHILVKGHTSDEGAAAYNQRLS